MSLKSLTKETWINVREYIIIALGLFMYAAAWKAFLLPHQIVGGGVTGIGALVYYATGLPISIVITSYSIHYTKLYEV